MKLHLPVRLFKSVLACLAAVASFSLGSGVAWAEAQNLTFSGSSLIWDTRAENKSFVDEEDAAASFAAGDNVSFTGESTVTLGENITAGTLDIAAGADVTIDLGNYTLNADAISLSGTLNVGDSLSIASGSTLAVQNDAAVLDSALVLGEKSGLVVESAASLNNNALTLQGGSTLILTAAGDGKTYTLLTGISSLLDKNGDTLTAGSYSVNEYFDKDAPGSGFWAGATLVYTADGTLQIVRHEENVQETLTFSTRQTGNLEYNYYAGIAFKDITVSSDGGAIYGDNSSTITLDNNGSVTFSGNTASSSYYTRGGAIYGGYDSTITLSNNGSVTFSENSASNGGAIDGYHGTISLSNNGSVTFSGNTASCSSAYGGAINGSTTLSNNGSVTFSGNTVSSTSSSAYGGAIYGDVTMTGNGSVEFIGNKADSSSTDSHAYVYGGAICGSVTMTGNGRVTFSGNTATASESATSHGGAIYGDYNSTISLSDNDSVSFTDNTASSHGGAIYGYSSSTISLSDNGSVTFSGNTASRGGAIYGGWGNSIELNHNSNVSFSQNSAGYGGAIYGDENSSISLDNNGSVTFSGNSTYDGGAIYGGYNSTISLSGNKSVEFSGNSASYGGAIYGSVTMTGNGSVSFTDNTASSYGGAIYVNSSITLSNNGSVSFTGNTASSYGGAIYGDSSSTISLSGNKSVEFSGNSAFYGGAIYGNCTITLSNNDSVTFSGNVASSSDYNAYGGAIYTDGNLDIQNNGAVLFEKNEVKDYDGSYHLRSIYVSGDSFAAMISLSAAAGKSIEFRDSVYFGSGNTVNLNADYTDAEGNAIKQQGDILFTGKYTETHLNELLASAEAGRTATAEEILNSRTTEVNARTHLYGGRLRVEDGAVYQGQGITAHEASEATVRVKDATLSHAGYNLEFNVGTALEVAGNSTIRGNVNLKEGSLFKLEKAASLSLYETLEADAATLTVNGGALLEGGATLNASLTLEDGATLEMTGLEAGAVTLSGALTFGGQVDLGENLLASVEALGYGEMLNLFTGVSAVTVGTDELGSARVQAGTVFSNVDNENVYVEFRMSGNVGSLLVVNIPEPTTATLSLLALAGLAARRRRK